MFSCDFLITAATRREIAGLIDAAGGTSLTHPACREFHEGRLGSCGVVVAVTGIGKANTAMGVTFLLERYRPRLLINTGCAGAYPGSGLAVGDVTVAISDTYGDDGVETDAGWLSLEDMGLPLRDTGDVRCYNEIPLSVPVREAAVAFASERGGVFREGKFVTVSTCSGTDARGRVFGRRFNAICENMEGAAAAHVALSYGIDCLEVRGVSNMVEDRDLSRWNIHLAVENVQRFLREFIPSFGRGSGRNGAR